jgi:polyphosphate kinase
MVRSFDKRIESLFLIADERVKQQVIHILDYNLRDNVNAYEMQEDGSYVRIQCQQNLGEKPFDIHQKFFEVTEEEMMKARLFSENKKVELIENS